MSKSFLSCFVFAFFLCAVHTQASVTHYFLKVQHNGKSFELRRENAKGHTVQKIKFRWDEKPAELAARVASTGLFEKRLWVYFHCMWGNNGVFHRYTLPYMDEIVDNGQENILLSVIWPARHLGYKQNWKKVSEIGHKLGNFFLGIVQAQQFPVSVISHSMGNRVFQGVWQQAGTQLKLQNVILAAADLDADVFAGDFKNMSVQVDRIIVVQHHNDRLLLASSLVWGRERLGRTHHIQPAPANMVLLDATPYISARNVDLSNHMHFIFADSVRHQLNRLAR